MAREPDNPFHVLELPTTAAPAEVDKQGRKLLGMLELGMSAAATYGTPDGARRGRDADMVRWAMGELGDPVKRIAHELWALEVPVTKAEAADNGRLAPLAGAHGFRWWSP